MNLLRLRQDMGAARRVSLWLLILLSVCLVANAVLALACVHFAGRERVVLVPPEIHKSFWVEPEALSAEYLEQMGYFLLQLTLNVTPQNVDHQARVLLRYADPEVAGALRSTLTASAERLKRDGAATVFSAQDVSVDLPRRRVTARGRLTTYVSDRRVSELIKTYHLGFTVRAGRVSVVSFQEKDDAPTADAAGESAAARP